ncbi:uncharacterized protein LOC129285263 [Prosopis cineraria]|uniref:uncharacterized protein LOC129285263 n=1 Tax=Prosopis cineraria TaxID=364024 RepID=UPI00240F9A05|nr:uncharacterized protein LOC129285263 [Prosopis cineraria]
MELIRSQSILSPGSYHMDAAIALMLRGALLIILLAISISRAIRFISPSPCHSQLASVDDSSKDHVVSTSKVSSCTTEYDVFLSFHGEDTSHNFVSYLYKVQRTSQCKHSYFYGPQTWKRRTNRTSSFENNRAINNIYHFFLQGLCFFDMLYG